ncbi:MAG TPA: mandelate racemase/muconate lactonizing enzyme family protein [Chloroflexota bacterium]|nr:mandelate racemase/muconate lactonizing enzyme family protein [Chloroflexota bacterium]
MRITQVQTIKLRFDPPGQPMADAIHFMPSRMALLVQVHTDAGLVGLGEAAAYGGTLESMDALVIDLGSTIVGQDPFRIEKLWQLVATRAHQRGRRGMLMQALSGIDIALWDIVGQATRTPLYRVLGGYHERLPAYASAGFYKAGKDARGLAEEVRGYKERGFRAVKIKVGRQPDALLNPLLDMPAHDYATVTFDEDVERVHAARAALGPSIRLAIDANNAWTPSLALSFMRAVEDQNIFWLEEPVHTEDLEGSAMVAQQLTTPVSGYETETGLPGFRDLIARRAVDIVQPDVIWSGGITECRKVAALAQAYGLPVIPHNFSSAVAAVANMHLIASISNGSWLEVDQNPNPLRTELFQEQVLEVAADGTVGLPEGAGLGVTLNQATIDRYRVN